MAPNTLTAITANWHIKNINECIPKTLYPKGNSDASTWGSEVLKLLYSISAIPSVTIKDFRAKLRIAIDARKERNKTAKGKVGYMTASDLRVVLGMYRKEEKDNSRKKKSMASRRPSTKTPATPASIAIADDDDEEEEEYENSSAPVRFGKYAFLSQRRAIKVNLNPDASVAAKPKGRKRGRWVEEGREDEERPLTRHQDNDARQIDDTGFLSGDEVVPKPKKRGRPSRINQDRIRMPHWQHDIPAAEPTPFEDGQPTPTEDAQDPETMGENDNVSISTGSVDLNELRIPTGATTRERLDFFRMRRRIWADEYMIRMLRVELRGEAEEENGDGG
jgi:hypothetical protein